MLRYGSSIGKGTGMRIDIRNGYIPRMFYVPRATADFTPLTGLNTVREKIVHPAVAAAIASAK
jgi:hypothetical protein